MSATQQPEIDTFDQQEDTAKLFHQKEVEQLAPLITEDFDSKQYLILK